MVNPSGKIKKIGQATKSIGWMPWRKTAMKDVVSCDKPRGVAKQTLIRGFPNGETQFRVNGIISKEKRTGGIETS